MRYARNFLLLNVVLVASTLGLMLYRFSHPEQPSRLVPSANHCMHRAPYSLQGKLFDVHGVPKKALLVLLSTVGLEQNGTLSSIVEKTQASFLRPSGQERWEMHDRYADYKATLLPLLDDLGMVRSLHPLQNHYTYAFVLGALYSRVKDRFDFLIQAWQQGVRFDELVLLGGNRSLLSLEQDELRRLAPWDNPLTETDMMKLLYKYAVLPTAMQKVPLVVVNAQAAAGARRPNTADTLQAWIRLKPLPGSILAVSSQPLVGYQHAVLKTIVPEDFAIETVGNSAPDSTTVGVYLDTLARWLYQEKQLGGVIPLC